MYGVEVQTDTEVTADDITAAAPDYVVLACGAAEPGVAYESTASTQVVDFNGMMSLDCGPEVVVLGGNVRAVDCAIYLAKQGKHVSIVTPDPMSLFEKGHSVNVQGFLRNAFTANGGRIYANSTVSEVGDGTITFMRNDARRGDHHRRRRRGRPERHAAQHRPHRRPGHRLRGPWGDCAEPWEHLRGHLQRQPGGTQDLGACETVPCGVRLIISGSAIIALAPHQEARGPG